MVLITSTKFLQDGQRLGCVACGLEMRRKHAPEADRFTRRGASGKSGTVSPAGDVPAIFKSVLVLFDNARVTTSSLVCSID
jgi:hypothetical protein